ncbi:MAG: hypothetical protein FWC49_03860 [Proteobacteria bacterium]|nr:hypothetical protein [Pseudomonadota bacterium]
MAIDYYGLFPCKVRESISDADLLRMEKARNRANAVLEITRKNPQADKSKPESEWTFKTVVLGPDGPQATEMRVADLLAESAPLGSLAANCVNCPSNIRSSDFGCGGTVHYPITALGENWLVSRLPADLNTPAGQLLTRAIADFGYNGAAVDAARGRKEIYETDKPAERKWGGFFSKKTKITSSQIMQMAFLVGNLQPTHAKLIAYFLGFLNDDFSISNNPINRPQPDDDSSIIEMKIFFSVAALAGISNVSVLIDA